MPPHLKIPWLVDGWRAQHSLKNTQSFHQFLSVSCNTSYLFNILIDQQGFRMRLKKKDGKKKYYICPRKVDLNCPVAISLDIDTDMIVHVSNEIYHQDEEG